jgi:CHAD domain-containing protein
VLAVGPGAAGEQPLEEAAVEMLRRAWRAVRRDMSGFAQASPDRQHRLRKRLKRLRYALEFLQPLLRRKPALGLHARVCGALDALGELGDLQGALAWSRAQAERDPQAWFVVGWLAARREQVLAGATRALARLERAPRIARRK